MIIKNYFVIGVMSGTSLDGIDLAYIQFTHTQSGYKYKILHANTQPYSADWQHQLKNAIYLADADLEVLNKSYSLYLSQVIAEFISVNAITTINCIGSHGHTIKHRPDLGYTLQIGNLPEIKQFLLYPVICDFRVQDVALGGQGAPLVPIGDELLFSEYEYCLNLGGFSNVSFHSDGQRKAFDLTPVNTVFNLYCQQLDLPFDDQGKIARSGKFDVNLFNRLNAIDFYAKPFPKSLGIEFVHTQILPMLNSSGLAIPDIMRTFSEHIAYQIIKGLPKLNGKMLLTGGGAYNTFLIELLQQQADNLQLIIPDALTIEFKEALLFGFLGLLRLEGNINVLASVTGAQHDHSSGIIYS